MKVLYLAPERTAKASLTATTVIDEEIGGLASAGVQVHVIAPDLKEPQVRNGVFLHGLSSRARVAAFAPHVIAASGIIPFLKQPSYASYVARFESTAAALVRQYGIDVVHSHFGFPGGLGGIIAGAVTGRPVVASFRGMELAREPGLGYGLRLAPFFDASIRRLLRSADRTLYVSDFMRREGVALGAPADRASTVPKGVDLSRFGSGNGDEVRSILGANGLIVLAVANLLPVKGVEYLIQAFGHLSDAGTVRLVICGTGPELDRLKRLAGETGVSAKVHFVGKVGRGEIADYFAAADIFVLPSVREASGNVLLEAAAAGVPSVCTASGGPPEYVLDGVTGFVVPPRDIESIAAALSRLLSDDELRTQMGVAARHHAEANFSYRGMIDKILRVYESIL